MWESEAQTAKHNTEEVVVCLCCAYNNPTSVQWYLFKDIDIFSLKEDFFILR